MPLLYDYNFELGEGILVKVAFYDDDTNIISAESLGQIDSNSRRSWAKSTVSELSTRPVQYFTSLDSCKGDNLFVARMVNENWGDSLICLIRTDAQYSLQIYRLIFYYLFD